MAEPGYRTAPAAAAGELGAVIRHASDGLEMVNLTWGLEPKERGGRPFTVVRSEGRQFSGNRCLVPASEFHFSKAGTRYRFTLVGGDWFYFAGVWRGASREWPEAYAVLTVAANSDVAPYHDRQMAVIRREDRMRWLEDVATGEDLLRPLPPRSFTVEAVSGRLAGQRLFDW